MRDHLTKLFFILPLLFSMGVSAQNTDLQFEDPNIETALVAFYGVVFIGDVSQHNPTSFYNSESPKKRQTFEKYLRAAESTGLQKQMLQSLESLSFQRSPDGEQILVNFMVPSGRIFYLCHSHEQGFLPANNHCDACISSGSLKEIRVSEKVALPIFRECPR